MDRTGWDKTSRSAFFERTIASLLSLALKTERIALLPLPIRFFYLWFLRSAERRMRSLLADMFDDLGIAAPLLRAQAHLPLDCYSRREAMHLAAALRRLAGLIGFYAAQTPNSCWANAAGADRLVWGNDGCLTPPHDLDWLRARLSLPGVGALQSPAASSAPNVLRAFASYTPGLAADHPPPI